MVVETQGLKTVLDALGDFSVYEAVLKHFVGGEMEPKNGRDTEGTYRIEYSEYTNWDRVVGQSSLITVRIK
jgi:hypothetical protein